MNHRAQNTMLNPIIITNIGSYSQHSLFLSFKCLYVFIKILFSYFFVFIFSHKNFYKKNSNISDLEWGTFYFRYHYEISSFVRSFRKFFNNQKNSTKFNTSSFTKELARLNHLDYSHIRPRIFYKPIKDNVAQQAKISLTYQVVLFPSQGGFQISYALWFANIKCFTLIGCK